LWAVPNGGAWRTSFLRRIFIVWFYSEYQNISKLKKTKQNIISPKTNIISIVNLIYNQSNILR